MGKVKKENVITITEDTNLGNGLILEKGDTIKIVNIHESVNEELEKHTMLRDKAIDMLERRMGKHGISLTLMPNKDETYTVEGSEANKKEDSNISAVGCKFKLQAVAIDTYLTLDIITNVKGPTYFSVSFLYGEHYSGIFFKQKELFNWLTNQLSAFYGLPLSRYRR